MRRALLIIAAGLALLLAGCGGGDSSSSTSSSSSSTSSEEKTAEEKAPAPKENAAGEYIGETSPNVPLQVTIPKGPPPKKLVIEDLKQGKGPAAKNGDKVTVHYVGVVYATKEQFDANWENEPFSFNLGAQEVIPGWDKGIPGMKVGGKRKLIIPPSLAYGSEGVYPSIPPSSTLIFVVELLSAK